MAGSHVGLQGSRGEDGPDHDDTMATTLCLHRITGASSFLYTGLFVSHEISFYLFWHIKSIYMCFLHTCRPLFSLGVIQDTWASRTHHAKVEKTKIIKTKGIINSTGTETIGSYPVADPPNAAEFKEMAFWPANAAVRKYVPGESNRIMNPMFTFPSPLSSPNSPFQN